MKQFIYSRLWPVAAFGFVFIFFGCQSQNTTRNRPSMPQGIEGQIRWFSGNLMPSPDVPSPKGQGVSRKLLVYAPVRLDEVTMAADGGFYSEVPTELVATIVAAENGTFKLGLPPGKYSLFVEEEGKGLYANRFNAESYIYLVEVLEDVYTEVMFKIDYDAAY